MGVEPIAFKNEQALFLPPKGFRQASEVRAAWLVTAPPHSRISKSSRNTAAQKAGKRYEKKVIEILNDIYTTIPSPWISFDDKLGIERLCQPDCLVIFDCSVVVVEIKRMHTVMAWFQLRKLYEPVVRCLFPDKNIVVAEVTSGFDPRTPWPESVEFSTSLQDLRDVRSFGVIQWRR